MEKVRTNTLSAIAAPVALAALLMVAVLVAGAPQASAHADGGALAAGQSGALAAQAADGDLGLTSGHTYVLYSATGSGRVLDVEGASKSGGANALLWSLNRNANQQWVVEFDADGYATLRSACSGQLLDVYGGSMASGANVIQWPSNGGANQKWKVTRNANGTYRLASAKSQSYSLDVTGGRNADGANVEIWANNSSAAQQWRFFDVTAMRAELASKAKENQGSVAAGEYIIYSNAGNNMALDVTGASKADGANIETWAYHGGAAQKFTVSYDADGYALIRNTSSGKYLDVEGASASNGANVLQWPGHSGLNQKWVISKNSDGSYRIQSALWADLSLDVHGGTARSGSNVEIYPSHNNSNQKWTFSTVAAAASKPISLNATVLNSFSGISLAGAKAVGVDVSHWNGDIDWAKVAASGVGFAIISCGYGDDYTSQDDSKFIKNVQGARNAGLDIGVYIYSYAVRTTGSASAESEANHTLRQLRNAGLSPSDVKYGVYYDLEDSSQASAPLESIAQTYCNKISASGYSAGVYASLSWFNTKLTGSSFNNWNRWIAQWPVKSGDRTCDYKGTYAIWQCMDDGTVPGITGRVDMNIAY